MRWRMLGGVVFAFACSYSMLCGFGHAWGWLGGALDQLAEQIDVECQPRFEVRRGTLTLPADGEKRLRIESLAGLVNVVPGGPETVAEYVIYARGEDKADARRRAEPVEVRCARGPESGDKIWVAVEKGERYPPNVSVELVVKTPPERALSIDVTSADIHVTGIHGGVEAGATSGDVRVAGSGGGPVVASVTSGDICVEDADGRVEARATSGNVSLAALRGPATAARVTSGDLRVTRIQSEEVSLQTSSGDTKLSEVEADRISAKSTSGGITLKDLRARRVAAGSTSGGIWIAFTRPFSASLEAEATSGNVCLTMPASSDCAVHATTVSGSISGNAWSEIGRREAGARLGAGTGSVRLSTTSGDIRLDAAS